MIEVFKKYVEENFDHSTSIPVSGIPFDQEVRTLCEQNSCGKFGQSWTCPPAVGSLEELQKRLTPFRYFLIFYKVYPLEDSFDWAGMMSSVKDFQDRVFKLQKLIKQEKSDSIVVGAGACLICEKCTFPEKKPCRFPEDALISIEAFGINAMKMMMENGLQYNNGPNTVTYIGGLFYK